jgi:hypothetical protein
MAEASSKPKKNASYQARKAEKEIKYGREMVAIMGKKSNRDFTWPFLEPVGEWKSPLHTFN